MHNFFKLILNAGLIRTVTVISTPFIFSIYGEENFGMLSFILSQLNIAVILSTFGLEKNIKNILIKEKNFLNIMLNHIIIVSFIFSIYLALSLQSELSFIEVIVIPLFGFIILASTSIFNILRFIELSDGNHDKFLIGRTKQTISTIIIQISSYLIDIFGLILGEVVGRLILVFQYRPKISITKFHEYKSFLKKNLSYIFNFSLANFLHVLPLNISTLIVFSRFGPEFAGKLSISFLYALGTINVISGSFAQSIYNELVKSKGSPNELKNLFKNFFKSCLIAIFAIIFFEVFLQIIQITSFINFPESIYLSRNFYISILAIGSVGPIYQVLYLNNKSYAISISSLISLSYVLIFFRDINSFEIAIYHINSWILIQYSLLLLFAFLLIKK